MFIRKDPPKNLLTVNRYIGRRLDAETNYAVFVHRQDGDDDIVTDPDGLAGLAVQYQHAKYQIERITNQYNSKANR